jgi:transposase
VAREESTSRYQVARAFREAADRLPATGSAARRGGCRSTRPLAGPATKPATVVSDLDRNGVIEVLDGRDRRTVER